MLWQHIHQDHSNVVSPDPDLQFLSSLKAVSEEHLHTAMHRVCASQLGLTLWYSFCLVFSVSK